MGWSIGFDEHWKRDVGYAVPAICDHPQCDKEIDRGLSYVCADSEPYGGEGCGLYFCFEHKGYSVFEDEQFIMMNCCERCRDGLDPFPNKPDHPMWTKFKMADDSWKAWRQENGYPEPTNEQIAEIHAYEESLWTI